MTGAGRALSGRVAEALSRPVDPAVADFAGWLAEQAGAQAVLFYGSNLRTGSLDGVLDYYVLLDGPQRDRIWPRVSYHEREFGGQMLRAKVATMALDTFAEAAAGASRDTTIWARFVQPSALVWCASEAAAARVGEAVAAAARTAARLAAALGPPSGTEDAYWRALFRATYRAEFRVESAGREDSILSLNAAHFDGLLPAALASAGIAFAREGRVIVPHLADGQRAAILRWWKARQRLGKPLNVVRLVKASTTFEGAARYAAWKVERHTGIPVEVTPWRERHPVLAAPGVLFSLWRAKRGRRGERGRA